jgi:hypothetical protein
MILEIDHTQELVCYSCFLTIMDFMYPKRSTDFGAKLTVAKEKKQRTTNSSIVEQY